MNTATISMVEDLEEVRNAVEQLVRSSEKFLWLEGYSNGEMALKSIPGKTPDIVIMDINLPGISGLDCIKKLKPLCPETQFIMFTIYEDDEKVFEALKAGAHGYLLKKTSGEKLLEALDELHAGGSPMSALIARKVIELFEVKYKGSRELALLTNREKEILELLARGYLYKEIASQLHITINTVKQYIHSIYEKLHVQNRTEAINKAFPNR